ncbi:MAG: LCP family protein, partial [Microbacteriaceae bacterium]|nr:LCP family protein [Microbacteriaceae bacterium]
FNGGIQMANAIGGVDVCVAGAIVDEDTGLNLPAAGTYNLSGYDALAFLRTRGGVGDGSDLGRVSSQQVYLSSLVRKIKADGTLSDLGRLLRLAQAALENMSMSGSLADPYTLVQMARVLQHIPLNRITFTQFPTVGGDPSPHGYYFPVDAGFAIFDHIRADQPFQLAAVGDDRGSTLDPNGALTPEQQAQLADNSGLPVLEGVTGSTAADFSCSVPYYG